jgi:hypothetical protein
MKHLYTATHCEDLPGMGQVLLPGAPMRPSSTKVSEGDPIHLKLPNGKWLKTVAVKHKAINLDESAAGRSKVSPGYYWVIVLPDHFLNVGLERGAEIYLAQGESHNEVPDA